MSEQDREKIITAVKEEMVLSLKALIPELVEQVDKSVEVGIKKYVNGKIDELRSRFEAEAQKTEAYRKIMAPAENTITFLSLLQNLMKWLVAFIVPGGIIWGILKLFGK